MTFFDASSALTTELIGNFSVFSHVSDNIVQLFIAKSNITKVTMCPENWDSYLYSLFQDAGIVCF